jgi:CO/xanthine dehydrogenase Mo-binding subunit
MTRIKRGVPVRLPDGTTRISIAALARELGCAPEALRAHVAYHGGGYAVLGSLPNPRNVGRRGGHYERREQ